jgi:hypothetical protein
LLHSCRFEPYQSRLKTPYKIFSAAIGNRVELWALEISDDGSNPNPVPFPCKMSRKTPLRLFEAVQHFQRDGTLPGSGWLGILAGD